MASNNATFSKTNNFTSQPTLSQAPAAPSMTKRVDKPSIPDVLPQSNRQSASQGGTLSDNSSALSASRNDSLNYAVLSQTTVNTPPTKSEKSTKAKIGSILSSKDKSSTSESNAKAVPSRTQVDGEPSANPSEPRNVSQPSMIRSNPAQSDQQSASQGGDIPSSTRTLGAIKSLFTPNATKPSNPNEGIDPPEPNADTTKGNTVNKTKNTGFSMFTSKNKSKRNNDLLEPDANAVLSNTTGNEDQTKPNTDPANGDLNDRPKSGSLVVLPITTVGEDRTGRAIGDPSVCLATSRPPSHSVKSDDHRPQTQHDANPPQAEDDANGIAESEQNADQTNENDDDDDNNSESAENDQEDEKPDPNHPPNIIVFGETGVGKSSLIRMLGGSTEKQPKVSGDATGCTTDTAYYSITIGKKKVEYRVWDTPGLNEGGKGTVPTSVALQKIHDRVQKLEGVNLLIYCIRGAEYRDILQVNYDLVAKVVCGGKIPVIAIVSWLENEEDMESWWKANKGNLKKMKLRGHACVTTTRGKSDGDKYVFQQEYDESKERVQKLIKKKRLPNGKRIKPDRIPNVEVALKEYMDKHNSGSVEERNRTTRLLQLFRPKVDNKADVK